MTEDEKENWECVHYRMDEEGFDYCFNGFSNWEEIKDEKFHEMRKAYLESEKQLRGYINAKVAQAESEELE